jgi:hypothetical protein
VIAVAPAVILQEEATLPVTAVIPAILPAIAIIQAAGILAAPVAATPIAVMYPAVILLEATLLVTVIRPVTHPVTVIVQVAGKPAAPIAAAMIPVMCPVSILPEDTTLLMTALLPAITAMIFPITRMPLAILKLQAAEILVLKTDQAVPAGQGIQEMQGTMTAP